MDVRNTPPLLPAQSSVQKPIDKSKLEVKKPGILNIVGTLLKNTESYGPLVKMIGYRIASGVSGLANQNISATYNVKVGHQLSKLTHLFTKSYYGDALIGSARNVTSREVIRNSTDYEATQKLLEEVRRGMANNPHIRQYNQVAAIDENPKFRMGDGICAGIRADIASRFFNGESIENIVKANAQGAPPEAAANQALYEAIKCKTTLNVGNVFQNIFKQLELLSRSKVGPGGTSNPENPGRGTVRDVDFSQVAKAVLLLDPYIQKGQQTSEGLSHPFQEFQEAYLPKGPRVRTDFLSMVEDIFYENNIRMSFNSRMVIDPAKFEKRMLEKINNNFDMKVIEVHLQQLEQLASSQMDKHLLDNYRKDLAELKLKPNSENIQKLKKRVLVFPESRGWNINVVDNNLAIERDKNVKQAKWVVSTLQMALFVQNPEEYKRLYPTQAPQEKNKSFVSNIWKNIVEKAQSVFGKDGEEKDFTSVVDEPDHRHIIENVFYQVNHDRSIEAVLYARGVEQVSIGHIIGHSSLYDSDVSYLRNLDRLFLHPDGGPGFYSLDFSTGSGAHAISLIINEDGKTGYILDPNGSQLKFNNVEEAQILLAKMMAFYPEPDSNTSDVGNHRLHINKYLPVGYEKG